MASRVLSRRIVPVGRPFVQQSRGVKYTTQFALDRKGVKDHAHSTAGTIQPIHEIALTTRPMEKSNPLVPAPTLCGCADSG